MGGIPIDETLISQPQPQEVLEGGLEESQHTLTDEERRSLEALVKQLETDPSVAGSVPGAPGPSAGQVPLQAGREMQPATSSEPLDPLGIRGAAGNMPVENMSPGRAALARAVQGWGESGSATIGAAQQVGKEFVEDFPKTWQEFVEKTQKPENVRAILKGSMGAAGGMTMTSLGPGGIMLGTYAGATVGGYLANAYEDIIGHTRTTGGDANTVQRLIQPTLDAQWDAAVSGSVSALPYATPVMKGWLARMLSLPPNSRQLVEEASSLGVNIGVANVANGGVGKGAVNVFGRMPLIGTSARKASERQGKAIVEAYNDMFGQLSNPNATTEVAETALLAARNRFGEWSTKAMGRYNHALKVGEEQGAVLSTDKVLKATGQALHEMSTKTGKLLGVPPADMKVFLNGVVKNLDDKMSTMDANNILIDLERLMRKADKSHGVHYSKLEQVQKALEETLKGSDNVAAKLLVKARSNFQEGIKEFETSIFKKMVGQVDRNIYAIGKIKSGTITADDLMETAAKTHSASAVRELRNAAGDDVVRNVARARLDDAWVKATGIEPGTLFVGQKLSFDAKRFTEALGLNNPNSQKYFTMKEMLRGSGVDIGDIEKLARVGQAVTAAPIADASTFMARAAVLRGAGGVAEAVRGALTMGAGGRTAQNIGMVPAIAGLVMMRWGIGAMMKPGLVKLATTAMDEAIEPAARAAALTQMTLLHPSLFNE